jgi:hypothetical protein
MNKLIRVSDWRDYDEDNLGTEHDFDYWSIVLNIFSIELRFELSFYAICNWSWCWEADLAPPCDWEPVCLRLNLPTLFFVFTVLPL